jgi:glycosyltransferase involved in cell wall biosynthesis
VADHAAGPIKIVRVIARLNIGGPAIHAILLTAGLNGARYQSRLVKGSEAPTEGDMEDLARERGIELVRIPELGREIRWADDVVAFWKIYRLLRRERPHIVHTHTAKAGLLGRLAARLAGVPAVVHTFHGHVFHGYFPPWKTRIFVLIERWLAKRTDRLLAVSDRVRADLLALGIGAPDRVLTVPLGLDLTPFFACGSRRGRLRAELSVPADEALVGIIARLVPIKRHERFLRAAAELARAGVHCRFLVVGDGERRAELETLASTLGVAARVHFLGWRRDLERVYADLDVAVLCSDNEGSPVSLIEAMAAGVAVVATRVGGVPDVVDDGITGLLVAPGDVPALARAIVSLLVDPERRRRMGAAGRERVAETYGADRLVADMDRLYADLVRR